MRTLDPTWKADMDDFLIRREAIREKQQAAARDAMRQGYHPSDLEKVVRAKRHARAHARRIGLAYWPALIWGPKVNPQAFVIAEEVMAKKFGRWDPPASHGGWDMYGEHGLSPYTVSHMWLAAGCKDGPKFRLQVKLGITAKKGDSVPFLVNYARGKTWADHNCRINLGRKALAVLGRLSPELRFAATRGLSWEPKPLRIRSLNWLEVQRVQALRCDPSINARLLRALTLPPRPAAVLLGREHYRYMSHPIQAPEILRLCPNFPYVSRYVATLLHSGVTPKEISMGQLTAKEAHLWLKEGGPSNPTDEHEVRESCIRFILDGLPLTGEFNARTVLMARWLRSVYERGAWSTMRKVRRLPDGTSFRYLDILDEITDQDLDRGPATGVERAFESAAQRRMQANAEDHRVICRDPLPRQSRYIHMLTTPAALAREGNIMHHCVGGYADMVERGMSLIYSVVTPYGRSTVELRPTTGGEFCLAQHRSASNGYPHKRNAELVEAWLNSNHRALLTNSRRRAA